MASRQVILPYITYSNERHSPTLTLFFTPYESVYAFDGELCTTSRCIETKALWQKFQFLAKLYFSSKNNCDARTTPKLLSRELALEIFTMQFRSLLLLKLDKLQKLTSEKKNPKEINSPSRANNNTNHKNYNFPDYYWLKNLLFSTNSHAKNFVIRQFLIGQFVIGQFNKPVTFKVAV